jgi:hypothetical protein
MFHMDDWVAANKKTVKVPAFDFSDTNRRLNMFGYTNETIELLLYPMGAGGKVNIRMYLLTYTKLGIISYLNMTVYISSHYLIR